MNENLQPSNKFDLKSYAIDQVKDAIYWCDEQARIVEVNKGACRMVGYTLEELTTMTVAQLDPNFPFEKWPAHWELLRERHSATFETLHRHKDGHLINIEVTANLIVFNGREINCAIVRDITERNQTEARLRESEEKLRGIFEGTLDGLCLVNAKTMRYADSNPAFSSMMGYSPEELTQLGITDWHPPQDLPYVIEQFQRSISGEIPVATDLPVKRKDGSVFYVDIKPAQVRFGGEEYMLGNFRDITERKAAEEAIKSLAFYDTLTGLPNRRLMMDRFDQALASYIRNKAHGSLLFIDLDNFKSLNDTLGHDIGDLLLQQAARRIEGCVRKGDTVSRLGGDEFVVLLENLSEHALEAAAQTESIGEKLLSVLGQPYQLELYEHHCTASIGVILFTGQQQPDELMKQADIAMYQAKKAGRNTLRFFDPNMQESINTRALLENDLRGALEKRQFQLHYQIQVDNSRRLLGAEALIRWNHPERGLVSPMQFIPLAEETGLILPIGLWVMETACAQLKDWQQDARTRDLVLAINVSAKQFHQADFVAQVQAVIQRYRIKPNLLKLELTESLLLEDIEDTISTMNALNDIGVQFSLDDFGTGYSSLQYLKRLPLDQLKIDQSFVRDIATDGSDIAVVQAIIAMANSLNLDVIAEGVETEDQRQLLLSRGCNHYQGYLFGRPVPIEQFTSFLKQG